MSESLYMMEIEQLLEEVSQVACNFDKDCECLLCLAVREQLVEIKRSTIETLVTRFGLNQDNAECEVAAACGEDL